MDRLLEGAPIHLVNTDPPYNVKLEPRSNNAIAAGNSSFKQTHPQKFDVERHPEKARATHWKMRAKYRPVRMEARGCSQCSIDGHRIAINRLCDYAACEVTLSQLSDDLLEGFVTWQIAAGRSPSTANGRFACILAEWRYAWRKKLVEELPRDCEKLPVPKRMPEAWSIEQMGQLLEACGRVEEEISGIPARLFWTATVLVLSDTGIRRSALLGLRREHLDMGTGILLVPAEVQKQSVDQVFKLHPDTLAVIRATQPETRRIHLQTHGGDER